ncbi:TPA: GPO family capsid scaffolding protein [Burkholderia territorii]|nr:GPO family capsid scaffolding protein [Burkholderia territorii]TXG20433.1 GPO family capsid scaffolding protein [Burkholderia territorii]HDR8859350.1 GPO family capsid scaffolding protein [Burkholderia territorii]HDR8866121.1 GPO family capsid scaffolding protein [Burkholderia territorii]HDR8871859.1 GPO family capsid scaffolding protein [Burkholderia territorii]HDR8877077.1 GPO family capsid scaffolding protein [Burkholderia territorii]
MKFVRVATEGATTDGRAITRQQIQEMADTYNPATYGARVFLEHIRGVLPDGQFRAYGDVRAVEARSVEDGKLALFAQIDPTDDLRAMTKARQKIYSSIEIAPNFADSGKAYLVGLGVTDSPASLGTEILTFSQQHPDHFKTRKLAPDNLFSVAVEVDAASLVADAPADSAASPASFASAVAAKFAEMFGMGAKDTTRTPAPKGGRASSDPSPGSGAGGDSNAYVVARLSMHCAAQQVLIENLTRDLASVKAEREKDREAFNTMSKQLESEPGGIARPSAKGGADWEATDC